jgi:hypothetical protein
MRTLVALVLVGWFLQQPWTPFLVIGTIVLGAGLLAWTWVRHWQLHAAPQTWTRVEPHFEEPQPAEPPQDRLHLLRQIEQLEANLKDTQREADALRTAKERLEHDLKNAKAAKMCNRPNPLFRRVGLDESAPEWVVMAVRRAYRKRLHPDAHPEGRKREAERRFKEAEQVFADIWRLKGFQS